MTIDFSRKYSPPGVYIEESESTLVSLVGIPPTLVALVGPARGYQVYTEQVVLGSTAVRLSKQGVDVDSESVTIASSGVPVATSDYSLTKVGDASTQAYYTDLLIAASPVVTAGTVVNITYRYTDPTYFAPKRFTNFEDVKDVYGEPLNTAISSIGDLTYQYVTSPLALAAMVALQNGATELVLCATTPPPGSATTAGAQSSANRTALSVAYAKLDTDPSINVLVALTDGIIDADAGSVLTDLRTALNSATQNGLYRFGITGFDTAVDTAPDTLLNTAGAVNRRLMVAYAAPGGLQMYSGGANATFTVGHQYLAAAYAGRMASLPVQYSITKQVIAGFAGLGGTPLPNSLKNQYAAAGIAVAEMDRFNRIVVRHGVTTDVSNVNTREAGVVRAKDALVTALVEGTNTSGLIGAPLNDDLMLSVKSAIQGILENAKSEETIVDYSDLAVRQTAADPSVVEVRFAYKPAYPLNYIVISFSIDMTTGVTDLNTDQALV